MLRAAPLAAYLPLYGRCGSSSTIPILRNSDYDSHSGLAIPKPVGRGEGKDFPTANSHTCLQLIRMRRDPTRSGALGSALNMAINLDDVEQARTRCV